MPLTIGNGTNHQEPAPRNRKSQSNGRAPDTLDRSTQPITSCRYTLAFDALQRLEGSGTCRPLPASVTLHAMWNRVRHAVNTRARAVAFLCVAAWHTQATAADVQRGKELSQQHCARCHVVGDFNPTGGISSTPSFQLLVKRRPNYRERFETFYTRRPHPAFVIIEGVERLMPELPVNASPVVLPIEAVDDIVAFVETLKPKQ